MMGSEDILKTNTSLVPHVILSFSFSTMTTEKGLQLLTECMCSGSQVLQNWQADTVWKVGPFDGGSAP